MSTEDRPLRAVVRHFVGMGRGGLLGGDNSRRVRWWTLQLECGHEQQRYIRYRPLESGEVPIKGGRTNRPMSDALDPPKRARCDECAG